MSTATGCKTSLCLAAFSLALGGCSAADSKDGKPRKPEAVTVGYVVATPTDAPVFTELGARVVPFKISQVRPQIAGIVRDQRFVEGSIVRQGQTLFQIDASLYQAARNEAQANLSSAIATAEAARVRAERFRPLAQIEAVSKQEYTDAVAQNRQAAALVAESRARFETANINLRFTAVPSPITGRIGRSLVTEGALVLANQTEPMAVIQQLDPIYVDIQQSSGSILALRRMLAQGTVMPTEAEVRLTLEDGSAYGVSGRVSFAETIVDPATGTVTLRARFANPQGLLLPGMFVRARFAQAVNTQAFLVPQQALTRDPKGDAIVFVVGANNRAEQRKVKGERTQGANWIVTEGLKPGDRIITQTKTALKPGAQVRSVPASAPQRIRAQPDKPK